MVSSYSVFSILFVLVVAGTIEIVRGVVTDTCGPSCTWTLDDTGLLVVSGSGAINKKPSWLSNKTKIKRAEIQDGFTEIGGYAFHECAALTSVSIPNSVVRINDNFCWGCKSLSSITIPESVTYFATSSFRDCTSLTSVEIPKSMTSIGFAAFSGCTSLTSVKLPNTIVSINNSAFSKCSALRSVNIPDSVTTIQTSAFSQCSSLSAIELPKNLEKIGTHAFWATAITSIKIPKTVKTIERRAFVDCQSLTSIEVDAGNSFYKSDDGILLDKAGTTLLSFPAGKDSARIPKTVTTIEEGAFYNCGHITSLYIPEPVSTIGNSSFYNCSSLSTVSIAGSVKTINSTAFHDCKGLSSVCYSGESDPGASSVDIFKGCTISVTLVTDKYNGGIFCGKSVEKVDKCSTISSAYLTSMPTKWLSKILIWIIPFAILSLLSQ